MPLNRHDKAVKNTISSMKRQGYTNFKADLSGYQTPQPIGSSGRVPDIVATKRGLTKIVELEPKGKVEAHADQHSTFRRHAAQKKRTSFDIKEF